MKTRSVRSLLALMLVGMTSITARAADEKPTTKDKAADFVQKQAVKQLVLEYGCGRLSGLGPDLQ